MKTPEEYFLDKKLLPDADGGGNYTDAERIFLQKYMGVEGDAASALPAQATAEAAPGFEGAARQAQADMPFEGSLDEPDILLKLREAPSVQLVAFTVGLQEYTVPIDVVQEVIRYIAPAPLPAAPSFISGVINLRGHITPLVTLPSLLDISLKERQKSVDFVVICRHKGLQLGLEIHTVKTMYRVEQQTIDWSVEHHLGAAVEYIGGLMKASSGKLIGIISIDKIVEKVLRAHKE